jgi:hypothetical protein
LHPWNLLIRLRRLILLRRLIRLILLRLLRL